jgi:hypothetical protein
VFDATILRARLYSRGYRPALAELAELRSAITRRDGAAFLHNATGFVSEQAARERVSQAETLTFRGGRLTTSEHADLLAAAIRDIAERHGVGTPARG